MGTPSITSAISAAIGAKVPKGFQSAPADGEFPEYFHCLIYGPTGSYKTTTAAEFGGPDRTLIVCTRDPEQVRIPLRGKGYRPIVLAHDVETFTWAVTNPEKAADAVGFPEWKDNPDRVLMVDDWTEGASLLVDDNSVKDDGTAIKDGRKIYGATKEAVREALNLVKRRRMHLVWTALSAENDWNLYPAMPTGVRSYIETAFDYVFYMDAEFRKMKTENGFSVPYPAKDEITGKSVTRLRKGFAKYKVPKAAGQVIGKEEPMDLASLWAKVVAARAK